MKLSTRAHYGLRAIVTIAKLSNGSQPVSVMDIAKAENISDTYLEQLVLKLRCAGLLKSYRGARGGYTLVKSPDEITVGEVMTAAGEKLIFTDCTSRKGCSRARKRGGICPSGYFWTKLNLTVQKLADETTVGELIRAEALTMEQKMEAKQKLLSEEKRTAELNASVEQ